MDGVAFPKAAGLCTEPVEPLHSCFLNQIGRLFHFTGMEGKSGSNSEIDRRRKCIEMVGDPLLLLWATEPNPDKPGA